MNKIKECIIVALLIAFLALLGLFLIAPEKVVFVAEADQEKQKIDFVIPELKAICACESVGDWNAEPKQWDKNGDVLRGRVVKEDIGMCQINLTYHSETAKKIGADPFSYNGNIQLANYIYEHEGNQPWSASKKCWGR